MKRLIVPVVLVLLVASIGFVAFDTNQQIKNLKSENTALRAETKKNTEEIVATNTRAYALPYEAYSLRRLAYDITSNTLYIPELRIKVPYTEKARSLLYTLREDLEGGPATEADITTDAYMNPQEETTLACTNFLRLKVEDKQDPYNPAEKATSFTLQDNRTLQVYYFTGELEGNDQCKKSYEMSSVLPKDFVEAFKGVESY